MIEICIHEKLSPRSVIIVFSKKTASMDEEDGPRFCLEEDGRLTVWENERWRTLYQSLQGRANE